MASVRPLALGVVKQEWADEVPSPPHDALGPAQRREHLARHPLSYLGVTLSPEDIDPLRPVTEEELLVSSRAQLTRLVEADVFTWVGDPTYFLYRLEIDGHAQTGLVCGVAVGDYDTGTVRIHERVRTDRAERLAHHLFYVGAQSSPIALGVDASDALLDALHRPTGLDPMVDVITDDGLHQQVWAVTDPDTVSTIDRELADRPLYLIDGHHRAAAASATVAAEVPSPDDPMRWMLSAIFPIDQLSNQAFHRVVPAGNDRVELVKRITETFPTRPVPSVADALHRHDEEILLVAGDDHLLITLPTVEGDDPTVVIANLDSVRLNTHVLQPVLGIDEANAGLRLHYRPGLDDAESLAALTRTENSTGTGTGNDAADDELVFVMRPVSMDALVTASDAGLLMPPKSTYFSPKVRSGIFVDAKRPDLRSEPDDLSDERR